jgi:replicative DNA helicase
MMILAQLNRALESRAEKRPSLSDLRDSGEIEENADLVLGLHREDYYESSGHTTNDSPTELNTLKFRNGPTIRFNLIFDKLGQKFERAEVGILQPDLDTQHTWPIRTDMQ